MSTGLTSTTAATSLRLNQVHVSAPNGPTEILHNLTFDVPAGAFALIVGPSGSGKTSLLRLLNRLSDPDQGSIFLGGQNIRQLPVLELRRQVVLVPQEPKLLGMTVEETLLYPLKLRGVAPRAAQAQMQPWLERLQIPSEWLERNELQLSLGQRQRIAIARALILSPPVLLLDEPTASLDLGQATSLLTLIAELTQFGNMTVLMANHQVELARSRCTYVVQLQQGKLVRSAPADQINWDEVKSDIIQAEQRAQDEWDDADEEGF
ncbi:MAG: ABC transporter ATP-binding protein [Thainema sp.]